MLMHATADTWLSHGVPYRATQAADGTTSAMIANGLVADLATKIILHLPHEQNAMPVEHASLSEAQPRIVREPTRGYAQWKLGGYGGPVGEHVIGTARVEFTDMEGVSVRKLRSPALQRGAETAQPADARPATAVMSP